MLRSEIRSEIFDLPVPSRHGKERQKEERNYSLFSCPIPAVPEMHLLPPRDRLIEPEKKEEKDPYSDYRFLLEKIISKLDD